MTRRRMILLAIFVVALSANFAYFLYPEQNSDLEFALEPLNLSGTLGGDRASKGLPVFDGQTWSVDGEPVEDLADYLLDTNEWIVPHTFGKIMLIELPESAGSQDFRASIASLAEQGICQVAVFQESAPVSEQGLATAVRVQSYLGADGHSHMCIDRVNGEI